MIMGNAASGLLAMRHGVRGPVFGVREALGEDVSTSELGGTCVNSKDLGADFVFAWPQAQIGVIGAKPAVGIIHRRELAAADDPAAARDRLADRYADAQLRPQVSASTGYVDELIPPGQTRSRLMWALRTLEAA